MNRLMLIFAVCALLLSGCEAQPPVDVEVWKKNVTGSCISAGGTGSFQIQRPFLDGNSVIAIICEMPNGSTEWLWHF